MSKLCEFNSGNDFGREVKLTMVRDDWKHVSGTWQRALGTISVWRPRGYDDPSSYGDSTRFVSACMWREIT